MKVGIFGGTFNPIHLGHIALMREMKAALQLDEIVVIPTAMPPHKDTRGSLVSGRNRLEMCRLAVREDSFARVSDIEIERGGVSFTIDTLRQLKKQYREDELWLLMGSDMFYTVARWCEPAQIMSLCSLAVVAREENEQRSLLEKKEQLVRDFNAVIEIVPASPVVVSSSEVRAGEIPADDMLDSLVKRYIVQNGLYGRQKKQLLDLDEITVYLKSHLSPKRFEHTLNVANEALHLAKALCAEEDIAYIAGLLHDICKEASFDEMLKLMGNSDIINNRAFLESPKVWHGYAAANFIQSEFLIFNTQIIDAVKYHTTGSADMSRMTELIYMADLISAERDYPGVQQLRAKTYNDFDAALLEAFSFAISEQIQKGNAILESTLSAYNRYVLFINEREKAMTQENITEEQI